MDIEPGIFIAQTDFTPGEWAKVRAIATSQKMGEKELILDLIHQAIRDQGETIGMQLIRRAIRVMANGQ